ncbi:hypothetical protein FNF29_04581 [Cafeteria roenbergensis]|uniref:C2H2-type domain-containing protein n=1 Tax=Cafeteria roenbergensis TaxID=33653 RepID=A0A5A8CEI1_CAFRO|nr:hypothetical protein FNF29_04581 [Cafeteria roenbergensis]|eukprot:KAA0151382.1 hypothetical protein FNF29_04581 [Cafeteria roenbergensis]
MSGANRPEARRRAFAVVVGTTGAGKTKLSIDLCEALDGEVINADSMQMYKDLDVATAKVTREEARGVPHHLLSFLEPWESFTVRDFRRAAAAAIDDVLDRGKLPVVVGGTGYYVQALLRESLLEAEEAGCGTAAELQRAPEHGEGASSTAAAAASTGAAGRKRPRPTELPPGWSSMSPYERLVAVDPDAARRVHPGNTRRVQSALDVFLRTGVPATELTRAQGRRLAGAGRPAATGVPAAAPLAVVLWVDADTDVLDRRLDGRVGSMLRAGLLAAESGAAGDEAEPTGPSRASSTGTQGLLVAIGYKELSPYFKHLEQARLDAADHPLAARCTVEGDAPLAAGGDAASSGAAAWAEADELLREGVRLLQLRTRQYARDQLGWIRRRFRDRGVSLTRVDSSDASRWNELVREPATLAAGPLAALAPRLRAPGAKVSDEELAPFLVPEDTVTHREAEEWRKYRCRVCGSVLNGSHEWTSHLEAAGHRSKVHGLRKRATRFLAMADAMRAKGLDEAGVRRETHRVPGFRALGSEERAAELIAWLEGRKHQELFDLPWPAEDGVPGGEIAMENLPAAAALLQQAKAAGAADGSDERV